MRDARIAVLPAEAREGNAVIAHVDGFSRGTEALFGTSGLPDFAKSSSRVCWILVSFGRSGHVTEVRVAFIQTSVESQ